LCPAPLCFFFAGKKRKGKQTNTWVFFLWVFQRVKDSAVVISQGIYPKQPTHVNKGTCTLFVRMNPAAGRQIHPFGFSETLFLPVSPDDGRLQFFEKFQGVVDVCARV
jgi:hypothetical protein